MLKRRDNRQEFLVVHCVIELWRAQAPRKEPYRVQLFPPTPSISVSNHWLAIAAIA